MKTLLSLLLIVVATVSFANDIKISGYILNTDDKTTIEVYHHGELIEVKKPTFDFYKFKLDAGDYMVVFKSGEVTKTMFISVNTNKHIVMDVDFKSRLDVKVAIKGNQLKYTKLPQDENFEL